jgi:hypothetical protein
MERIAEQTPGMVAAVSDYQDKYMANQKKITNAENKLIAARIKGDKAEIEAAEEELRLAKAAEKATEETFNKYFELVNYKFATEEKIESLRGNGNVKKSYEDIVKQGAPAYDPNNENLKMDYDIIASTIN